MDRAQITQLMDDILARQGRPPTAGEDQLLRDAGFRSLDFSELALRVEDELGTELNFDASRLRAIETVRDVVDFFAAALLAGDEL